MSNPDRRCWRYKLGEGRIFPDPESVPAGEGWVDSPAKVAQESEIEPVEPIIVSGRYIEAIATSPASGESPRRPGRKPRT